jgi:FAD:protein FMN transferase
MRRLKRLPQNTPIRLPNVEITKEVKPMMTIGERIEVKEFIPTKANDIPMAKASMLVAIAKGFGVDAVARLLERKGIKNYMVDIGGEVVVRGKNSKMNAWRIGINKPVDDSLSVNQELQTVLAISDVGMATSGNYRNFYYKGGKKYAHTIDPRTGYPVQHSILSSTVIAKDCASADAYATAFMVMGLDSAKAFCEAHPELDAYFICSGEGDKYETYFTDGMKKFIINEK